MVGTLIVAQLAGVTLSAVAASTALTIAAFAINFAVSSIITRVFAPKGDKPQDMGVREQVPPSSVNAIPVVYGDAYLGGTFVDAVLSEDQKVMYYVLAVSSISSNGLFSFDQSKFYYGERLVTFSGSGYVIGATVSNGGSGYVVGNVLTVSGGTATTAAQLTVTEVSGGQIVSVQISTVGSYTENPDNPVSVTGGAGTGARFILKYLNYGVAVKALSDEAGNIDTNIRDNTVNQPLEIYLYTADQNGIISRLNTTSYPWDVMGGSDITADLRWPSTGRRMNGLAFAIVRLTYNQGKGTSSLSPITFHASHYLNGTGVAKPGDVWYDYITNPQYGGAVDTAFVDSAARTLLNAYADEVITFDNYVGTPATQPRYRFNGVLDAGQTVLSNLDRIMSCCDSWLAYNAALGQWSVVVNKAETAAYAFDDDNIIGEIRVSATDITQSVNQVEAKFPDKDNRDHPNFVNLSTPSGLLYPNEPVNKSSITYDLINDSVRAQYLANRVLEQAREDLIVSFNTTYYGIQVDAGTVVSVTNADYGWTNKLFRVIKVNEASLPDGSLGARLELNEYSAAVYDDSSITEYVPVANSDIPSPEYFSPLGAPTIAASRPNENPPTFDVQVTLPATGRVTWATLYYTTSATPAAYDWKVLRQASAPQGVAAQNGAIYGWTKISLPVGSYYFAWIVGNEVGQSARSTTSSVFNWSPLDVSGAIVTLQGEIDVLGIDIDDKLSKTSANILTGTITPDDSGGIKAGTIAWDASGVLTSGSGVAITQNGIVGAQSGTAKFTIDTAGNATFAGDINTAGDAYFAGNNPATAKISYNSTEYDVDYSVFAYATTNASTAAVIRNGLYGYANTAVGGSALDIGVIGNAPRDTRGVGVFGQGGEIGGYFTCSLTGGVALVAYPRLGSPTQNAFACFGRFQWGTSYIYGVPAGVGAFMKDDGTWAHTLQSTPTNSGTATVTSSNQINLLGSTSTGIAGAYVGTSASGSTVTWTIQTTSPSDRRLKQDIEDSDLGLAFVNQLQPKKYKLKADPKQQVGYGFIADEVAALGVRDTSLVYHEPDWQVGEETGFDTIHYPSYVAILTKAIQELSAKVDALQTEIADLKKTP